MWAGASTKGLKWAGLLGLRVESREVWGGGGEDYLKEEMKGNIIFGLFSFLSFKSLIDHVIGFYLRVRESCVPEVENLTGDLRELNPVASVYRPT